MKKDKKFLEELESFLGRSKYKKEIISKYEDIIKNEKANGKKIKDILKSLGSPEEIAKIELEKYKKNKSNIFVSIKNKFASLKSKKEKNNKKEKLNKKNKKEKASFKARFTKFKELITRDFTFKKERKVTDTPKEIVLEVKEEVEDKISDVAEIVSETHVFETKAQRRKRIILRTLGVILTCLLAFIWLWVTIVFFASIFAYLDGVKFKGIVISLFSLDLLVLWIVIMVNRLIFKKKMSFKLNIIISFTLIAILAFGIVLSVKEISAIDYIQDVSDKYSMTRRLETYDLPKEEGEKFIVTFNSNYNTQYVIDYDKNIKGKVKIDTRYYECYYDYYVKTNTKGAYISLKLDDRDRFSVYLDDIKEGKIYDNDELSRYTVKITINPDEAEKLVVQ